MGGKGYHIHYFRELEFENYMVPTQLTAFAIPQPKIDQNPKSHYTVEANFNQKHPISTPLH